MLKGRSPILGVDARSPWAKGADLWYDFTKKANGITDTHADTIYAARADGLYLPYAANVLTRDSNGLQTVPTRTNLAWYSFTTSNAEWLQTFATKTAGQTAPSGFGSDAALITSIAVGTSSLSYSNGVTPVAFTSGTTYTMSRIVKAGSQSLVQLTMPSATFGASQYANFDVAAGTIGNTAGVTAAIQPLADGWYRISITLAATASASSATGIIAFITSLAATRVPNVTLTTTFYDCGAQIEVGTFASPPIVTAGASATVNGNQQVISGLGTQLAVGVAGIVQVNILDPGTAGTPLPIVISDGTTSNRVALAFSSGNMRLQVFNGGGAEANVLVGAWATGVQTIAFAVASNYAQARRVADTLPTPDTVVAYPVISQVALGGQGFTASGNNYQFTKKLALKFGPQDATTFDEWYQKALTA